jgi:hypothetical protein
MSKEQKSESSGVPQITAKRLAKAVVRRVVDVPRRMYWVTHPQQTALNTGKIEQFKDLHKGKRCFVMGNGPSLKNTDLTKLHGEICLGANRIHLISELDPEFKATYLAVIDNNLLSQFWEEIARQPQPKFISDKFRRQFQNDGNACLLRYQHKQEFCRDIAKSIAVGSTVTFINLQLAHYMGFSEVIIIGCDHSYEEQGTPHTDVTVTDVDKNHFSANYYGKGHTFRIPAYKKMEQAYALARKAFEEDGRKVVDATVGGKLKVFQKVDYDSLF